MGQQTKTQNRERSPERPELAGSALPGQITQPNPLELFWEKNRTLILAAVTVVLAIFGGMRLWRYLQRLERNRTWTRFAAAVDFTDRYTPWDWNPFDLMSFNYKPYRIFGDRVRSLPAETVTKAVADLAKTPAANLARWMLAGRYALDGDEEGTRRILEAIARDDASDPGLVKRDYPPVYVPVPDTAKPKNRAAPGREKDEPPAPEPAAVRDLALGTAGRMKRFRDAHRGLYDPPEPDAKPEIVFETTAGTFKVRLYSARAKKHCEQFLKNCREKYYDGMRFHEIRRTPTDKSKAGMDTDELAFLGDPASKDDKNVEWGSFHSKEQTEHEPGVSHFPFMVGADRQTDKTGSDRKLIYFTANDCARNRDDAYVAFGRVVDGQDVIERITAAPMLSTGEEQVGRGKPAHAIQVTKVTVVE